MASRSDLPGPRQRLMLAPAPSTFSTTSKPQHVLFQLRFPDSLQASLATVVCSRRRNGLIHGATLLETAYTPLVSLYLPVIAR
jgi:hypothetical protein